jgi:two-component system sensor histidine kinase/response regulator
MPSCQLEAAEGHGQHTPIVALTADALAGDDEKSRAAGMDDYLAKPITPERLAAVVERWATSGADRIVMRDRDLLAPAGRDLARERVE